MFLFNIQNLINKKKKSSYKYKEKNLKITLFFIHIVNEIISYANDESLNLIKKIQ